MMKITDRHCRSFLRRITKSTLLYTEMVSTGAILKGDRERWLGYSPAEKPLALQLGGVDPLALGECARLAEDMGYDEVNLNVGCPSPRVQTGNFGVCLMQQPQRVADAVAKMRSQVAIPVTVKHRIGVDELDRYEDMAHFVELVAVSGCDRFIVHARKAWLQGLSPKENRTVPPLRYEDVHRLKREFPELRVEINGGFTSLEMVAAQLDHVDGVMIGRAADSDPYLLATVDQRFFGSSAEVPSRHEIAEQMVPYIEEWLRRGEPIHRITRHMLGLFSGQPGARGWRRVLSERGSEETVGIEMLYEALSRVSSKSGSN